MNNPKIALNIDIAFIFQHFEKKHSCFINTRVFFSWLDHLSIWKHYYSCSATTLGYYTPYYLDQQCSSKDNFVKLTLPQSLISSNDAAILCEGKQ